MSKLPFCLAACLVLATSAPAHADPTLAASLRLTSAQAQRTDEIEARYRREMASLRQAFNRESRAMRRARLAHEEAEATRLEGVAEALRQRMIALREDTDEEIRAVLGPAQQPLFDAHLEQRRRMHGSSRDERMFEH